MNQRTLNNTVFYSKPNNYKTCAVSSRITMKTHQVHVTL